MYCASGLRPTWAPEDGHLAERHEHMDRLGVVSAASFVVVRRA